MTEFVLIPSLLQLYTFLWNTLKLDCYKRRRSLVWKMEDYLLYNHNDVKISNTGNTLFCKEHKGSSVRKEWLIFQSILSDVATLWLQSSQLKNSPNISYYSHFITTA